MAQKPQTLEELEAWVASHDDHGKINGQPVIKPGTVELRSAMIPGNLYDEALLIGAAFSFTKSDLGTHALFQLLASPITELMKDGLIELATQESKTEFRAYIPSRLYDLAMATKEELSLNNSQLMTLALSLFVSDLGVRRVYSRFLVQVSESSGLSPSEIEQKIFDCRRYEARVKRLELSRQRGEFVTDRKLS